MYECLPACESVHQSAQKKNNSASVGGIFLNFDIWVFFRKSAKKIQISVCLSVCLYVCLPACESVHQSAQKKNNSASAGGIFLKFDIWVFFFSKICRENSSFFKICQE